MNEGARLSERTGARMERGMDRGVRGIDRLNSRASVLSRRGRDLQYVSRNALRAESGLGRLRGSLLATTTLFTGLSAALAVDAVVKYADSYKLVQNQLRVVIKDTNELAAANRDLFSIAQESRAGFESTGNLYARLARSTESFQRSQTDLLTVTQAVQQALIVSGSSMQEANAAATQLGQGLASNRLQGDELRSILENAPRLAIAIADGFGVGIGRLRELGKEGELTGERVFKALIGQADVISSEFAKTEVTISQALQQVDNGLLKYIGETDDALSVSDRLAQGLTNLAENIDTVADSLALLAVAGGATFFGRGIDRGIGRFRDETRALRDDADLARTEVQRLNAERDNARNLARSSANRITELRSGNVSIDPQLESNLEKVQQGIDRANKGVTKATERLEKAAGAAANPSASSGVLRDARRAERAIQTGDRRIQRQAQRVQDLNKRISEAKTAEETARGTINQTETRKLYNQLNREAEAADKVRVARSRLAETLRDQAAAQRAFDRTPGSDLDALSGPTKNLTAAKQATRAARDEMKGLRAEYAGVAEESRRVRETLERSSESRATKSVAKRIDLERQLAEASKSIEAERALQDERYVARQAAIQAVDADRAANKVRLQDEVAKRQATLVVAEENLRSAEARSDEERSAARARARRDLELSNSAYRDAARAVTQAQQAEIVAIRQTQVAYRALNRVRAAGSALLGAVGGVPGLVVTGALVGITALFTSMARTNAEMDRLVEAGRLYREEMEGASTAVEKIGSSTQERIQIRLDLEIQKVITDVDELNDKIAAVPLAFGRGNAQFNRESAALRSELQTLIDRFKKGEIAAADLEDGTNDVSDRFAELGRNAGVSSSRISELIGFIDGMSAAAARAAGQTATLNGELASLAQNQAAIDPLVLEGQRLDGPERGRELLPGLEANKRAKVARGRPVIERYRQETKALGDNSREVRIAAEARRLLNQAQSKGGVISRETARDLAVERIAREDQVEAEKKAEAASKKAARAGASARKKAANELRSMKDALQELRNEAQLAGLSDMDRQIVSAVQGISNSATEVGQVIEALKSGQDAGSVNPLFGEVEALVRRINVLNQTKEIQESLQDDFAKATEYQNDLNAAVAAGAITAGQADQAFAGYVRQLDGFKPYGEIIDATVSTLGDMALDWENSGDYAQDFGKQLAKIILQYGVLLPLAERLKNAVAGGLGGSLGGGGGGKGFLGNIIGAIFKGFSSGGYTGNGGTNSVAGAVHGQEFVAHAGATRKYRPFLEQMNAGTFSPAVFANTNGGTASRVAVDVNVRGVFVDENGVIKSMVNQTSQQAAAQAGQAALQQTKSSLPEWQRQIQMNGAIS